MVLQETPLTDPITALCWPIVGYQDDDLVTAGSAIIIAPQLAIATKHTLDNLWRRFEQRRPLPHHSNNLQFAGTVRALEQAGGDGQFHIALYQIHPSGAGQNIWGVSRHWFCPLTDIAVLFLEPVTDIQGNFDWEDLPYFAIDIFGPSPDTPIKAFGYPDARFYMREENGTSGKQFETRSVWTNGIVLDMPAAVKFPAFMDTMHTEDNMSGGPILNANDELVGLVLRGVTGELPEGLTHLSYGLPIWPSLDALIDYPGLGFGSRFFNLVSKLNVPTLRTDEDLMKLHELLLARNTEHFGPDHQVVGDSSFRLAESFYVTGSPEKALPLFEQAIRIAHLSKVPPTNELLLLAQARREACLAAANQ